MSKKKAPKPAAPLTRPASPAEAGAIGYTLGRLDSLVFALDEIAQHPGRLLVLSPPTSTLIRTALRRYREALETATRPPDDLLRPTLPNFLPTTVSNKPVTNWTVAVEL